jgi:outer membrane protein
MKKAFVIITTVFAVICAAGCNAGGQDSYNPDETVMLENVPQNDSNDQVNAASPAPESASRKEKCELKLNLQQCLAVAFKNNPEIIQRQWDVKTAGFEKDIARGALLPSVYARGGYEHYRDERLIQPRRRGTSEVLQFTDDLVTGDIVLTMPLYTGGRLQNQLKAADLLAGSAQQLLAHSRSELVFNITSVYYSILGQREVINSLIFSQESLEEHFKRTRELMAAQKAAHVDLLRTEVRLADIEQQLLRERNTLNIQRFVLASLLGCDAETEVVDVEGKLTLNDIPDDLDNGLKLALLNRNDYQSLTSRVDVRRRMVDVAKSRRMPEVSLQASYGSRWDSDDFDQDNEVGSIGIFAEIPLFEGGRIEAGIRRERSRLSAAEESLRHLKLQIQVEVETAVSNIDSTKARIGVTEKAVETAKESLRIEREKYDLGKGAIVDVLDAQSALLSSQMNYYRALADCNTAIAQFHQAVGRPVEYDLNI